MVAQAWSGTSRRPHLTKFHFLFRSGLAATPSNVDRENKSARGTHPGGVVEFLLTALSSSSRDEAQIGDLNERFADDCKKLGCRRAVRLYWARTLRSLAPLLRRAVGKALK